MTYEKALERWKKVGGRAGGRGGTGAEDFQLRSGEGVSHSGLWKE